MAKRAPFYRIIFGLAALYNVAFGAWAGFFPLAFFRLFDLPPPLYPSIWRCLGMVVGTYGLAYAASRLDRASPFIAIGLVGKVLGPAGWIVTVSSGEWPARTFPLVLFNDVVWWLPFALFLLFDGTRAGEKTRAAAGGACAVLNGLAVLAMLVLLRPGTEAVADPAARVSHIAGHPEAWRAGWLLWVAAALSLLAFYAWWAAGVEAPRRGLLAFLVALAGLACDLAARGFLCKSVDAALLPPIWPTLRRIDLHVDRNVPGLSSLLALAARLAAFRRLADRVVSLAFTAPRASHLVAVAPAVLAARALAEGRPVPPGLVPRDRQVEPGALLDYLERIGVDFAIVRRGRRAA